MRCGDSACRLFVARTCPCSRASSATCSRAPSGRTRTTACCWRRCATTAERATCRRLTGLSRKSSRSDKTPWRLSVTSSKENYNLGQKLLRQVPRSGIFTYRTHFTRTHKTLRSLPLRPMLSSREHKLGWLFKQKQHWAGGGGGGGGRIFIARIEKVLREVLNIWSKIVGSLRRRVWHNTGSSTKSWLR